MSAHGQEQLVVDKVPVEGIGAAQVYVAPDQIFVLEAVLKRKHMPRLVDAKDARRFRSTLGDQDRVRMDFVRSFRPVDRRPGEGDDARCHPSR